MGMGRVPLGRISGYKDQETGRVQGYSHTHSQDRVLTISAMASLECFAAEKIMSSAPSKGAEPQSLQETCSLGLRLHNRTWWGRAGGTHHNYH